MCAELVVHALAGKTDRPGRGILAGSAQISTSRPREHHRPRQSFCTVLAPTLIWSAPLLKLGSERITTVGVDIVLLRATRLATIRDRQ
jgi:hypothetical protein